MAENTTKTDMAIYCQHVA